MGECMGVFAPLAIVLERLDEVFALPSFLSINGTYVPIIDNGHVG